MTETLSDFADRQVKWLREELDRRAVQVKREIPRPFGHVEVPEEEQVAKYVDFRTILMAAAQGHPEAAQKIEEMKKTYGLKEMAEEIRRVHPMYERRVNG